MEFMDRKALTPGKLYARLSSEFRRLRPEHCGSCRMPMVVLTHRMRLDDCNWTVERAANLCEKCRVLVAAIVRRASEDYDLHDPISVPFFPHRSTDIRATPALRR
jgi:hypothetical protein